MTKKDFLIFILIIIIILLIILLWKIISKKMTPSLKLSVYQKKQVDIDMLSMFPFL